MKQLALIALFFTVACASMPPTKNGLTPVQVRQILVDAQWGVSEACTQQWLAAPVCGLASDAILTAVAITDKNTAGVQVAVKQSLVDTLAVLPIESRAAPFLNAIIRLL